MTNGTLYRGFLPLNLYAERDYCGEITISRAVIEDVKRRTGTVER